MRDSMKSKRANRAEGDDEEEEEEEEEGKEPAVATTAADSSALAMVWAPTHCLLTGGGGLLSCPWKHSALLAPNQKRRGHDSDHSNDVHPGRTE